MATTRGCGDIEGGERGSSQVLIEAADAAIGDHVERARHRKCRDRDTGGERLKHNETERVGAARKHEDVGSGVVANEIRLVLEAGEMDSRITLTKRRELRAIADDDLRAGQVEIEKGRQVL